MLFCEQQRQSAKLIEVAGTCGGEGGAWAGDVVAHQLATAVAAIPGVWMRWANPTWVALICADPVLNDVLR